MKHLLFWIVLSNVLSQTGRGADDLETPAYLKGLIPLKEKAWPIDEAIELPCAVGGKFNGGGLADAESPHQGASIIVHVNQILIDYLRAHPRGTAFPSGSVLLKEKFTGGKKAAGLYTKMVRKASKKVIEDWTFSAKSLDGSEDPRSFKESRCLTCHEDFDETGFVSESTVSLMRAFITTAPSTGDDPPG